MIFYGLLEKAYFIVEMTVPAAVQAASSDFRKAPKEWKFLRPKLAWKSKVVAAVVKFRKYARGLYFSKDLFEGLIFGGAYIRKGLSTERDFCFKIDCASLIVGSKFTVLLCFTLYLREIFQVQGPGSLYLEGRFNGGLFELPVWGGSYLERLIFGILRYLDSELKGPKSSRLFHQLQSLTFDYGH